MRGFETKEWCQRLGILTPEADRDWCQCWCQNWCQNGVRGGVRMVSEVVSILMSGLKCCLYILLVYAMP